MFCAKCESVSSPVRTNSKSRSLYAILANLKFPSALTPDTTIRSPRQHVSNRYNNVNMNVLRRYSTACWRIKTTVCIGNIRSFQRTHVGLVEREMIGTAVEQVDDVSGFVHQRRPDFQLVFQVMRDAFV